MSEFGRDEEIDDIQEYIQVRADKKLTNSPLPDYAKTTDYEFSRFKINYGDQIRDETLKS